MGNTKNRTILVKSVFEFADKDRYTCLMILFDMMSLYRNETGLTPDSNLPMFVEIESSAFYLIKLAEEKKLNIANILNCTADDGTTVFSRAANYSEPLAIELLKKNVVVTTVDNLFMIPSFRVS